ncbi:hypothetical protein QTN47_25455 [Danxiaibacter flavus]|uniref:Secreted protein n=1 Tax=Danxiaibacter flavus TaxID=3049108 RepID=A0ABV3ZLV7_9BACT|nr:hypothetical protein QNM32_25460 [Chitinophagaceae bacterium DXS]
MSIILLLVQAGACTNPGVTATWFWQNKKRHKMGGLLQAGWNYHRQLYVLRVDGYASAFVLIFR